MKYLWTTPLLLLSLNAFASSSVQFGSATGTEVQESNCIPLSDKKIPRYTIQLTTTKTVATAKKNLQQLPKKYRKETKLYRVGHYITARYKATNSMAELKPLVQGIQKAGFKDALIIKTTKWHMETNLIKAEVQKSVQKKPLKKRIASDTQNKQQEIKKEEPHKKTLSKFVQSSMVLKADSAYKKGDESTAMIYYEMLYNSGYKTARIKNNLCYLYGKKGAWFEAEEIIKKEKYSSKLIYAYAYGALESNQENFIQSLSEHILIDKTGKLALLAGYYYEQKEDMQRALVYYKMAYEKNPSSLYDIYAYARALDIQKRPKEALKYYKKTLNKLKKEDVNYVVVYRRIQQLKEL